MQESSVTRRVRVGGVEPEDTELRAELFRTLAGYGVIEEVCFEEDRAFHSGAATVQFQRLSSSERLQNDMETAGRQWVTNFLPPVVHVGSDLLVTSPKAIDAAYVRSLVSMGEAGVTMEEKILLLPGTVSDEETIAVEGAGTAGNKTVAAREAFMKALSSVKARAVGRFALLMTFTSVHDANNFLTTHQMALATSRDLYVVHVGSNATLQHALKQILLTRRAVKDVTKGSVLRGIVIPPRHGGSSNSMTTCLVDAGLTRKGRPVLLHTQTNFMKVSLWDTVEVRVTSLEGGNHENFIEAGLRSVVAVESGPTGVQSSVAIFNRSRQINGPSASNSSAHTTSSKVLAGKLYQALHARKTAPNSTEGKQHSVGATELVHKFPQGFYAFSLASVCVQRVGEDGLYARMVPQAHVASGVFAREWPVFVPSFFVPRESGMDWREFAVPGERMTVVLLFATALGGSEAALRFVASKRETDIRRASALAPALASASASRSGSGTNGGGGSSESLAVGTTFSASRAVWLPRAPGTEGPVYILLPSSAAPTALFAVTIFLHATGTSATHSAETMTIDAGLHSFVIADVVCDDGRGHYAVAVEEVVYRQMEAERRAAESLQESKQDDFVRRILSEMLSPAGDSDASVESRKRPRSL